MTHNLFLDSMAEFSSLTLPILETINAKTVCEIGTDHNGNSNLLCEWLMTRQGKLLSVDQHATESFKNWSQAVNNIVTFIPENSHAAIPNLPAVDAWFLDGDHNWYSVYNELMLIREASIKNEKPLLIFMHDVSWPCGRRDFYNAPNQIPEAYRQPHTFDGGIHLNNPGIAKDGFRSQGAFAMAMQEGGERNGVLTALDDFTAKFKGQYCFAHIPAVLGLGVLFDLSHPCADLIAAMVLPFHNNPLLQSMENNRITNYLNALAQKNDSRDMPKAQPIPVSAPIPSPMFAQEVPTVQSVVLNDQDKMLLAHYEQTVLSMTSLLADEVDHPELWELIRSQRSQEEKINLHKFTSYLNLLLSVPQEKSALKVLGVLHAICQAYSGSMPEAKENLIKLSAEYNNCFLVQGAIQHVGTMHTPMTEEVR